MEGMATSPWRAYASDTEGTRVERKGEEKELARSREGMKCAIMLWIKDLDTERCGS